MGVIDGYRPPLFSARVPDCVAFVDDERTACPTCGHEEYQAYCAFSVKDGVMTPLPRKKWIKLPPVPCPYCRPGDAAAPRARGGYRKPAAYRGAEPDVGGLLRELREGRWVWLQGDFRTGKTAMAHEVCRITAADGTRAVFATARDYCEQMAASRDYGSAMDCAQVFARYANAPLLALDDVGRERATGAALADLWGLVDRRASDCRPTLFTSNLTSDRACRRYEAMDGSSAGAVAARLRERCTAVTVP